MTIEDRTVSFVKLALSCRFCDSAHQRYQELDDIGAAGCARRVELGGSCYQLTGDRHKCKPKGLPTPALKAGDECKATARDALPEAAGTSSDKAPAFCLALACNESGG